MASHLLLAFQIIAHLGLVVLAIWGNWSDWFITFFVYFLTGCLGMSITYHRLLSHRSFRCPNWVRNIGVFLGTIGLTGSALAWVAVHRQHHSGADRPIDPHSPVLKEWWRVQFFSMYFRPNLRFVRDLLRDDFIIFCHRRYIVINLAFAALLFLINPFYVISGYLAPAALLWHGGSFINTLGHIWGYRNFPVNDKSVNNPLLGILMFGEGWHNNHHARPDKKSFSAKWWEFDLSYLIIRMIERRSRS